MKRARLMRTACLWMLVAVGCASAPPPASVQIVNDPNQVQGCRVLGTVSDNEMEDLQKKAAKLGGNAALMTPDRKAKGGYFGVQDYMTADVYHCDRK